MLAPSQHTGAVAGEDAGLRQLPEGWVWTRMGNVATIVGGGTPSTSDSANFENGEIPWITPADLSGYADKFISRGARNITERGLKKSVHGSCARIRSYEFPCPIGYVAIASVSLATNQGFKSFILPSGIDSNFVYYLLLRSREEIQALGVGTTFKEVSATKAATIPLPLPPLPEQHRIVAEIEKQFTRLDASVAALKRVQANMKRYRASVLKAACEGKLVPTEAELAEAEGPGLRTRRPALGAHPGRTPRPMGVPGEPPGQVQGAYRARHLRPARFAGGVGVEQVRPSSINARRRHRGFCD